jgi:hypothetical protein
MKVHTVRLEDISAGNILLILEEVQDLEKIRTVFMSLPKIGALRIVCESLSLPRDSERMIMTCAEACRDLNFQGQELIETTIEHPFWVVGKGWVEARVLEVGDLLWTLNGDSVLIDRIDYQAGNFSVYNFEVEDSHTYFVSQEQILVHNSCAVMPTERTIEGYVEHAVKQAGGEITVIRSSGREVFRIGPSGKHQIVGPHIHPLYRNIAPDGRIYEGISSGAIPAEHRHIRDLYKALESGSYRTKGGR